MAVGVVSKKLSGNGSRSLGQIADDFLLERGNAPKFDTFQDLQRKAGKRFPGRFDAVLEFAKAEGLEKELVNSIGTDGKQMNFGLMC